MDVWWCLFFGFFVDDILGFASKYQCPKISLKNGKARSRNRGKFVRFACNTGYLLAGDKYAICVEDPTTGKYRWDDFSMPRCVRPACKNVNQPKNGLIYPSHSGAVLNYFCKPNYHMSGQPVVYCNGTHWDNPAPACLPVGLSPPLSCDFEEEDLCGWTHDLNHDFDWRRLRYKTPSWQIGTGPSYDHTKGEGQDGYYMYIESTGRNENDKARLISPVFDKTANETCLEFYYHMYGSTTGDLRVYVQKISNPVWNFDPKRAVFWKSGNQGNRWYRGFVQLGTIDDQFQIIMEGVRKGYISDIAIDDVKIIPNCVVDEDTETTTELFSSISASTTDVYTIESCEDRCDLNGTEVNFDLTCDCDSNCWKRNRCCPDYFDFCIAGRDDTTEMSTTLIEEETTEPVAIESHTTIGAGAAVAKKQTIPKQKLPPIQFAPNPATVKFYEKTNKPLITDQKPKQAVVVPKPAAVVPKPAAVVPKPDVVKPKPAVAVPKPVVVVPKPTVVVPKPTVVVPKPDVVVPKPAVVAPKSAVVAPKPDVVVPKPPANKFDENTIKPLVIAQRPKQAVIFRPPPIKDEKSKPTMMPPTNPIFERTRPPKIIYVRPPLDERNDLSNDVMDLPTEQPDISETEVFVETSAVKENMVVENHKMAKASQGQTTVFVVGIVFGILFGMLVVVFVTKRLAGPACGSLANRHRRSRSYGSNSEVRFLTDGEDTLDLDLAY